MKIASFKFIIINFFFSFIQSAGQISRTESYIYILWWVHLEVYYYIKNGEFSEMLLFFEMCCVSEIKSKKKQWAQLSKAYTNLTWNFLEINLFWNLNWIFFCWNFLLKLLFFLKLFVETYFYVFSNLCLHSFLNTKILKSFHSNVTNCTLHWFYRTTNSRKLCTTHFLYYQWNSWPY